MAPDQRLPPASVVPQPYARCPYWISKSAYITPDARCLYYISKSSLVSLRPGHIAWSNMHTAVMASRNEQTGGLREGE